MHVYSYVCCLHVHVCMCCVCVCWGLHAGPTGGSDSSSHTCFSVSQTKLRVARCSGQPPGHGQVRRGSLLRGDLAWASSRGVTSMVICLHGLLAAVGELGGGGTEPWSEAECQAGAIHVATGDSMAHCAHLP
uniref:Secreted protein n=1 Tax=Myotis myotis TaxID=51298 RepID=A0A7J7R3P5_MYOMY|nr:hypothetical protein mMyoMyo1_010907 [Myotis myotis]